ncbi:MAG TPA: inner membrane CreD family protein, partial [Kiloniellaceae bacterium]|nr:inner membrane CreD family protein [Kiloniellaceae bacterium]
MQQEERALPRLVAGGLGLKVAIVIALGLIMLVPLELVRGIIVERAERAREVTAEIAGKWAGEQALRGPFLLLPAERFNPNVPNAEPTQRLLVLLPEQFTATVDTATEIRSR